MAVNTVQGRSVSCVPEQVGWPYGFQVQWCTAVPLQHGCLCLCTGVVVYTVFYVSSNLGLHASCPLCSHQQHDEQISGCHRRRRSTWRAASRPR